MEHIGQVIGSLKPGQSTEHPMSTENHAAPDKTVFGVTNGHHTFRAFKQVGGTKEAYKAFKDLADGKVHRFSSVMVGWVMARLIFWRRWP